MKLAHLLILPVLATVTTGCTVHNHYYASGSDPSVAAAHQPGQEQLAAKLKGIHAAMEVTADNIANAETLGYKARRVSFHEGNPMPIVTTDWTVGTPVLTGKTLDLFIDGSGFFQIEVEQEKGGGIAYTRLGQFYLNRDGEVVLGQADGPRLAGGLSTPIDVINISVSSTGVVLATLPDNSMEEIGQIELHSFVSPQGLERDSSGLYFETEASGPAITAMPGEGAMDILRQSMLESSNVNLLAEIMELENLARWGQALARELGPSAIQQHRFYTLRRQADLDVQVGLVKQLEDAMNTVYGEQTAELPLSPSLDADD